MKACLSHPVTSVANKIASLFADGVGVHTKLFFYSSKLKIYFDDKEEAVALASVIKKHFKIGKLHLDIEVLYKAGEKKYVKVEGVKPAKGSIAVMTAIAKAFGRCPSFVRTVKAKDPCGIVWYFVLGSRLGCQYLNDDIQNPWSVTTELAADIFKFCLNHRGVQISTDYEKPKKASKK